MASASVVVPVAGSGSASPAGSLAGGSCGPDCGPSSPSTVQPRVAGDASALPARSIARTANVCGPSPRSVWSLGESHAAKAPPSSRHSKRARSSAVNEKAAERELLVPSGPAVIVVSGAVVSSGGAGDGVGPGEGGGGDGTVPPVMRIGFAATRQLLRSLRSRTLPRASAQAIRR